LRALFSGPGRGKKPDPRVRYGQPFLPGLAALGRQQVAEAKPFLERATAVRGRRLSHLGRTVGFPGRIDWDPAGLTFAWRTELNSLDDLLPLGVAAALAPRPEARRKWYDVAANLVREWIAATSPSQGAGWQIPALARRIPNLIYFYIFFAAELRADPRARLAFLESLDAQTRALAASLPGPAADHTLIHAARALFMAGRFFDGMEARAWLDTGAATLWGQLREQVHEDGGHRERNLVIHSAVLAAYLEIFATLLAAHDEIPVWARKRVRGMADFLARMVHPDGEIPLFHGAAVGTARSPRELLAAAGIVLHEPELAPPGDLPGVWPLLIVGESGRRVHVHLPRRRETGEARALRRTGFYVLPGDPGDLMLLDGGSPPPAGDPNVFGYELSIGGTRLIVDSGVGSEEPAPWPQYFATTRAHNVVSVAGQEQGVAGRPPMVSEVHWIARQGLMHFAGTHDGFAHLSLDLRLRHRRRVFCLPGRFWLVCDEILGNGEYEAESFIHLHPDAALAMSYRGRTCVTARRSETARLDIVPAGAREIRVVQGVEEPQLQGWYAPRHGERWPSTVVSLVVGGRLPLVFGYALLPRAEGPTDLRFEHDAFRLGATLETGGEAYEITVVQGEVELVTRPVA
jgi:hypothetical protein